MFVEQGDHVAKGRVLTTLKSAEMAGFEKDRIRSSELYKSGLSSQKNLELAKATTKRQKPSYGEPRLSKGSTGATISWGTNFEPLFQAL